jgi:hypothetical protein
VANLVGITTFVARAGLLARTFGKANRLGNAAVVGVFAIHALAAAITKR